MDKRLIVNNTAFPKTKKAVVEFEGDLPRGNVVLKPKEGKDSLFLDGKAKYAIRLSSVEVPQFVDFILVGLKIGPREQLAMEVPCLVFAPGAIVSSIMVETIRPGQPVVITVRNMQDKTRPFKLKLEGQYLP
jgi:hypothetical protein